MSIITLLLSTCLILLSSIPQVAAETHPVKPSHPEHHSHQKAIKTEMIQYKHGDHILEGYLAYDANQKGKRPGVLVIHEWTGLGEYVKGRTRQLAEMGYVAFAADIYGKGVRPAPPKDAGAEAGKYYKDRNLAKGRALAGLEILKNLPLVDFNKTAAMGYCFGGTMTLELARSGAPLKGFISFHGGLNPTDNEGQNIKGKVLILHGAADPFIPSADITKFQQEMDKGKVDWQMIFYSGAVHAFTNPEAGNDTSKGAAYQAQADKRSWLAMKNFLNEIFQ